jgi:hypothetical protein
MIGAIVCQLNELIEVGRSSHMSRLDTRKLVENAAIFDCISHLLAMRNDVAAEQDSWAGSLF